MSDLSLVLKDEGISAFVNLPAWSDVENTFRSGKVPHCWAVRAPSAWHGSILNAMARMALCDSGRGSDHCSGCSGWSTTEGNTSVHPDLIVAGEFDKAANVEACRVLIRELSLKPAAAKRRLGVIPAADKLLVHAANSLLKTAEEPPSHACLLFLMEGNDFLPTLRSRSRFTVLTAPFSRIAAPLPASDDEWLSQIEKLKDDADVPAFLSGWVSCAMDEGKVEFAARLERLRLLIEQKRLSHNMVCDLLFLTLREELPFEHIFGGIW